VCGIKPADIGFNTVKITPHLGGLMQVKASMPHLKGRIHVDFKKIKKGMEIKLALPKGMTGIFEFEGMTKVVNEGENKFTLISRIEIKFLHLFISRIIFFIRSN
jgi:hypothetical protein